MSVRRALVDCVVLSLHDACVFYPCCKGCFSRIDVEEQDTTRFRCLKCGYSCLREQVDYRYRLSLRVTRDRWIFGVTVFGACLNQFFGIHASGLQRLVENLDGASPRSTLLEKAVQDCFIGRHFIFGIKVTTTESGPWFGGHVANGSSSKVHYIASQMILPKATGLEGCTVVSYYRLLLQKAAEYELGSTDPGTTSRPPAPTLLLIPHHSPASSIFNASGFLSLSQQSSQYQDGILNPTPPWQQSPGLVTSSAEQERSCSTQDGGDEHSRRTDNNKTPHRAQRGCLEYCEVTEERALSPFPSSRSPSFAKHPCSSIGGAVGNTPTLNISFSPSAPGHNSSKAEELSTKQLTETDLLSSLAWEDLPFSESLTEFLCEENNNFDIVSETEPRLNVQNQKETARNNLDPDKKVSHESASACQRNMQITDTRLLDTIGTPAPHERGRHDLSDRVYKNPAGCANKSQDICSRECFQDDDKVSFLSLQNEEEEQLEDDTYNCSADLFGSSLIMDMNTNELNTRAETVRTATGPRPLLSKPIKRPPRSGREAHSTPHRKKLKRKKCLNRESLIQTGTQDLDFIPPCQSTPIVKVAGVTRSSASFRSQPEDSCASDRNQLESDSKKTASTTSSLCKLKCASAKQLSQSGRERTKENVSWSTTSSRHRFTPKRRFWKPDEHNNRLVAQQHLSVQRTPNQSIKHKCDSSDCDATDNEVVVPPTPAAETRLSVKLRRRLQTELSSSSLGYSCKGQPGDKVNCKRTLLDQTLTCSRRGLAQTANCDNETIDEDQSDCCLLDDQNEACDWSRDLFSDSV